MCPKCREEVTSGNRCIRCGKPIDGSGEESFTNPNFDLDRYERLKNGEPEVLDIMPDKLQLSDMVDRLKDEYEESIEEVGDYKPAEYKITDFDSDEYEVGSDGDS